MAVKNKISPRIAIIDLQPFLYDDDGSKYSRPHDSRIKGRSESSEAAQFNVASALNEAFKDTGFAIVLNHGIPNDILQSVRNLALTFFSFDTKKKSRLANTFLKWLYYLGMLC